MPPVQYSPERGQPSPLPRPRCPHRCGVQRPPRQKEPEASRSQYPHRPIQVMHPTVQLHPPVREFSRDASLPEAPRAPGALPRVSPLAAAPSTPPYQGRPFGESDQIDLELNAGDGDDAPGGVAMLIAFAESPNADMAPPGEKLGGSLRLPHWLRPPLPCFAADDAKRAAAKSLTVSAHTRALATGGQRSLAPKRAI